MGLEDFVAAPPAPAPIGRVSMRASRERYRDATVRAFRRIRQSRTMDARGERAEELAWNYR